MKMPNNHQSLVEEKKVKDYLLSETHEIGKGKAKFFKSFGFDESNIVTFEHALIKHSVERESEMPIDTGFGKNIR